MRKPVKRAALLAVLCAVNAGVFSQDAAGYQTGVDFRGHPWGTGLEEFTAKEGQPVDREEHGGLSSLMYEHIGVAGYTAYMLVYFSEAGLEGGTYYFLTEILDELMRCYRELQRKLIDRYGPSPLMDEMLREPRPYNSSWHTAEGSIHLKVNTRRNDPVTLWYSSPALTRKLSGPAAF
ncbi:MAG: hypothetical protein LBP23_04800 [Treponema sp.]|jgi:hypothetical protein|nr:hypothetical protein [Treponema sp.]